MASLARTLLRLRCPACGQGALYQGWFTLHELCPCCGVRYERWLGSWTMPTVLGYTTGALVATAVGVGLYRARGIQPGDELWISLGAVLGALLPYRQLKAAWIWTLWATGWVFTDAENPAGPNPHGSRPRGPRTSR